jgi:pullulanase/glycogen debranching enzyme
LAELLELSLLKEIEDRLRAVKPSILLIAEPWSFRGRVDDQLHGTTFSSWNDGFRDFIRNYVQGKGDSDGVLHYLKGCPGKVYGKPEQSVNYVESHDDRCFIDAITENPGGDGRNPTLSDIRRARLALAITFMSQGVPMLAAGQDFMRSKSGVSNTYLRGDLNALDYERSAHFGELREYCRNWISFRLSDAGCLLRLNHYPKGSFWEEYHAAEGSAGAILLNADESLGSRKLLFAVNPDREETTLPIAHQTRSDARLLATADVFDERGLADEFARTGGEGIILPSLQLAMWELQ